MKTPSSSLAVLAFLALVLASVPSVYSFPAYTTHHAHATSKYSAIQSQKEPTPTGSATTSPRTPPTTPTTTEFPPNDPTTAPPKTTSPSPIPTTSRTARPFDPRDLSVDDHLYANGLERTLGQMTTSSKTDKPADSKSTPNSAKQQPATAKDPKLTIGKTTKASKDTNTAHQNNGKRAVGQTQIKQNQVPPVHGKHGPTPTPTPTPTKHVEPKKTGKGI
ncbi:hypothetical protein BBJ28_00008323 [Nothophytophthora sp. Chile5]|nr:hypothetical protein BBJ28_00008323 [Nothophytophthora sp. Chile5]